MIQVYGEVLIYLVALDWNIALLNMQVCETPVEPGIFLDDQQFLHLQLQHALFERDELALEVNVDLVEPLDVGRLIAQVFLHARLVSAILLFHQFLYLLA